MSFIASKTYILENDVDYTAGIKGIVDSISILKQPTYLGPGPHTFSPTSSNVGTGLTVDISTIDGVVRTITGFTSTAGVYTPGSYSSVPSTSAGAGSGLTLTVEVNVSGDIASITIDNGGMDYVISEVIKIIGTDIPGGGIADDVSFLVDTISSEINTININQPGKDYVIGLPCAIDISTGGFITIDSLREGPISDNESYIMNIHILVTNTDKVFITHVGGSITEFPPGSLVAGATYPYSVESIDLGGGDANSILGMAPSGKVRFF